MTRAAVASHAQALLALSSIESDDVLFTVGLCLVETATGKPAMRSSMEALSSNSAATEDEAGTDAVTAMTQRMIEHILSVTLASHHAQVPLRVVPILCCLSLIAHTRPIRCDVVPCVSV
jgi:hypothetical protein